jgi:hypothetical protein
MNCRRLKRWCPLSVVAVAAGIALAAQPLYAATPVAQGIAATVTAQEFNLTQSEANRLSLFHDYNLSVIGTTPGDTTTLLTDPAGGVLAPMIGSSAGVGETQGGGENGPQRSWYVSATPIVGYDSDPAALNHARGSAFLGADLNAGYTLAGILPNGNPLGATFGYDIAGAFYGGQIKQADGIGQTLSATVFHSLANDTIRLSVLGQDQFTSQHGKSYLNSIDARPDVQFFFLPNVSIDAAYQYTSFDYFFPLLINAQDPDASRSTASFALHLFPLPQPAGSPVPESPDVLTDILRRSLHSATIGYDHVWNAADGNDYDYEANRIRFGLDTLRFLPTDSVTADFDYAHEWQNYLNANSEVRPLLVGRTERRRKDHVDVFTTRLNAELADLPRGRGTLAAFVQWDVVWDRSNFLGRDFNEFIVSSGITYRY